MNNATTLCHDKGGFSFRRLWQLLYLDIAFYYKQHLGLLLGGALFAFIPIILTELISLLFNSRLQYSEELLIVSSSAAAIYVSLMVMMLYNKKIHDRISPLYLQIPATSLEKYVSIVIMTVLFLVFAGLIGPICWTIYMLTGVPSGAVSLPLHYGNFFYVTGWLSLRDPKVWRLILYVGINLASYSIYLYSLIRAKKPIQAILWLLAIYVGIFVLLQIGVFFLMNNILDGVSINLSYDGNYLEIFSDSNSWYLSPLPFSFIPFLFAALALWLSYRVLHKKQIK